MLAARAAAEISPRQQHRRAAIFRAIQLESRIVRAVVVKSPIEEEKLPEAGPLDPLQELLGDDLVGIDTRPIQRQDETGMIL